MADALSRLNFNKNSNVTDQLNMAENFNNLSNDLMKDVYPVKHATILKEQQSDKNLHRLVKTSDNFKFKVFRGGETERTLICYKDKIVVPTSLQKRMVEWYHDTLCHPGMTRTEQTLRQHFWWKTLREDVQQHCSSCDVCQRTKATYAKYGHLPEKVAEGEPWEKLCVDMIYLYKIS